MSDNRQTWELKTQDAVAPIPEAKAAIHQAAPAEKIPLGERVRHACNVFLTLTTVILISTALSVGGWFAHIFFGAPNFSNAAAYLARSGNPDVADRLSEMARVCDNGFGSEHACASLLKEAGENYVGAGWELKRSLSKVPGGEAHD